MIIKYIKDIEDKAEKKLIETGCFSVPVDVFICAQKLNVGVESMEAEDAVSGVFISNNGVNKIGYNSQHHENRQRFTVAHELGHFVLHCEEAALFVDKEVKMYRDSYPTKEEKKEKEANAFAAALLMPKTLVLEKIEELGVSEPDKMVTLLASTFKVSQIAMTYRLKDLGIEYGM